MSNNLRLRQALFLMLMALPLSVFAHGAEIIYTLLVPVLGGILILIAMVFLRANSVTKGVLMATYMISLIIVLVLEDLFPYKENEWLKNSVIILLPVGAMIGMYYIIKKIKTDNTK